MEAALPEDGSGAVVLEYDRYLREGGEFDREVVEFRYWRKARRAMQKRAMFKDTGRGCIEMADEGA